MSTSTSTSSHSGSTLSEPDIYWAATRTRTSSTVVVPTTHHNATSTVAFTPAFTPASITGAPTPTASTAASTSEVQQRLPSAAIAGVAVGTSVIVILLALLAAFLFIRRRRRKQVLYNRNLLRSSIAVCLPLGDSGGGGKYTAAATNTEKDQPRDLNHSFPMPPRGVRPTPRRSNSMPAVGRSGTGGIDQRTAPLAPLAPPSRPAPRLGTPQGSGRRGSHLPQLYVSASPSLPGARYPPPQYPPPETPTIPSRVCSLQSQTRPAVSVRRPSTRSSKSHTLVRSQSRSSVASSAGVVVGPMVTFVPGAGRHSLPDGIVPAMTLTPRTSASSLIAHHGKVIVGAASSVEPLASAPSFQDIKEEETPVYTRQSAARNSDGGVKLPKTYSPYPAPAAVQSRDGLANTPLPLEYNKARPRDNGSRSSSPLLTDRNKARASDVRSIPSPLLENNNKRSRSLGAWTNLPLPPPPPPQNDDQGDRPVLERLSWDDDPMPLGLQIRRESSASVQPVPASKLPVRSVASYGSLHEQASQTFHTISSRAGSSAALIEDAAKEEATPDNSGAKISRTLPGSWWRGTL
ncbi:hypothetical protein BZA05DRAFT_448547 [Tricharina praecox]|uniref:uncharacterized protein n=1 Tax=Tricharina praecox TaxID=43433 RepID=UPI00221EC976|nr:uncharacterized protein BZA05DRAFT_448547 [Tricharina praecox]KAI5844193.1 hypothetical protein BZA05DRAFT_448547 [Tricharina praecox]